MVPRFAFRLTGTMPSSDEQRHPRASREGREGESGETTWAVSHAVWHVSERCVRRGLVSGIEAGSNVGSVRWGLFRLRYGSCRACGAAEAEWG